MPNKFEDLKIGAHVFGVHKKYVDGKLGGRIRVCRVKTFANVDGDILPVLTEVGNTKVEIDLKTHYLYILLKNTINAIRTKKKVR